MADVGQLLKAYAEYRSTFKQTSYDSQNNEYLCYDETQEVLAFDDIIAKKYPVSNERPKSFDAIYIQGNNIFLVEFKNEKKPDKKEIEEKLKDGKKELTTILETLKIPKKIYRFVFCLVYKKYIPKHERYKQGLFKSISYEFLEKYKKDGTVDEIFTEDVDFFTKQFKKNFQKELMC